MIFCVPTPLAMPAHLGSTSLMMLHLSAAFCDMIVAWAPESTNALMGWPLTLQLMYNIITDPKLSGLKMIFC